MQHSVANEQKEIKSNLPKPDTIVATEIDDPAIDFFDKLANISEDKNESELLIELIRESEIFIAQIIAKCLKFCPSAFDDEITKQEIMKLIQKASRFLWTHVSGTLEHFVLWWNAAPLACRPVGCTKYLREWLLMQSDEAPEPISGCLKSLGEILTVHVVGCLWDKQFRNCLILSNGKPDQKFDKNSEFYSPPHDKVAETYAITKLFLMFSCTLGNNLWLFLGRITSVARGNHELLRPSGNHRKWTASNGTNTCKYSAQ